MGFTPDATQRQAAREATDWFLLLNEEPDDHDVRRRFEAWHDASPLNAASWEATMRMSGAMTGMPSAHRAEWGSHPRESQPEQPARVAAGAGWRRHHLRPLAVRLGAILAGAALACVVVLAAPAVVIELKSDYTTTTGELRTVLLDDGSEVILAPQSAIAVKYAAAERRIDLLEGMAFFSVRKNAGRPFRVQAGTLQTAVLGTRFEVRLAGDGASVAVEEGLVALSDSIRPSLDEKLAAGQAASVTASGQLTRGRQAGVAPWRQRLLLADDRQVGDAVADLMRYYSGKIVIADASVVQRRVTGVYGLDDPEATLRDIARAIGADVHRLSPWLLIVTSK